MIHTLDPTMTWRSPGTNSEHSAYSHEIVRMQCLEALKQHINKTKTHTQNTIRINSDAEEIFVINNRIKSESQKNNSAKCKQYVIK